MIVHFQESGRSRNAQCGRQANLAEGEITLLRLEDAYDVETSDHFGLLVAEFDAKSLRDRIGGTSLRCGLTIAANVPGVAMVGQMLTTLCTAANIAADGHTQRIAERAFIDLLALVVLSSSDGLAAWKCNALFRRAAELVDREEDLGELTAGRLADRLGVSARALQMAFASTGTTPSTYLLERKLELAASRLSSGFSSVTEVAFDCGFSSSSHFSRSFSRKFGLSPSQYRKG